MPSQPTRNPRAGAVDDEHGPCRHVSPTVSILRGPESRCGTALLRPRVTVGTAPVGGVCGPRRRSLRPAGPTAARVLATPDRSPGRRTGTPQGAREFSPTPPCPHLPTSTCEYPLLRELGRPGTTFPTTPQAPGNGTPLTFAPPPSPPRKRITPGMPAPAHAEDQQAHPPRPHSGSHCGTSGPLDFPRRHNGFSPVRGRCPGPG
jgi:hypothetical protein